MELFVGNLPPNVTALDLRQLLGPCAKESRLQLLQHCDPDGVVHCFARVQVPSSDEAQRVMTELQAAGVFCGRRLEVRPFQERNAFNDRRAAWWRSRPWHGEERRLGDRRARY